MGKDQEDCQIKLLHEQVTAALQERKTEKSEQQKELEGKIDAKKVQLENAKATLDLIPAQYGYQNALEVTKAAPAGYTKEWKINGEAVTIGVEKR